MLFADSPDSPNWTVLVPIVAGGLAVWYWLPSPRRRPIAAGGLAALIGLAGLAAFLIRGLGEQVSESIEAALFFGFSGLAVGFAALMITSRNPARSALAFAVVILSTCGLFLLLAAPFLMAATIVIYAGAIIVTFLFVIMLSQQSGPSSADLRSREPELAVAAAFIFLATLLVGLQRVYDWRKVDKAIADARALANAPAIDRDFLSALPPGDDGLPDDPGPLTPKARAFVAEMRSALERVKVAAPRSADDQRLTDHKLVQEVENAIANGLELLGFKYRDVDAIRTNCQLIADGLTRLRALRGGAATFDDVVRSGHGEVKPIGDGPKQLPAANVSAIGRTLFSDHLLAIELAGTLLLVATVGAIAIAGRRREVAHA
jgi:NADH:ubiquinone oxidoreductase subunit 6 (subunit J)